METKTKEFVWVAKLSKENKTVSWGGRKDGALEQIILKLAVLGPGAKEGRNLVEVTTFDSEQNKIKAIVCALTVGKDENRSLGDLPLFPPANFTLVEGSGPVNIVASHLIMEDGDLSDEDDMSDFEESMEDLREKLNAKKGGKGDASSAKSKKRAKDEDMESDEDEDDEGAKGFIKTKASVSKKSKLQDDDDDDDDDDDEEDDDYEDMDDEDDDDLEDDSEEEEEEKAPAKKRKLTNGKAAAAEKKLTSPDRTKKPAQEQKTPTSQKGATPKTPKSEKKTPSKIRFTSVDEVKAAIKKFPGGKPRKQDKFVNWVVNQFKVTDESWKDDLWKWHKKEIGL